MSTAIALPGFLASIANVLRGRCRRVLNGRGCVEAPGHSGRCIAYVGRKPWRVEF